MSIEDLLARAKAANANPLGPPKKKNFPIRKPKNRAEQDIYIWQNRPVREHDWKKDRDIVFVSVYRPTHLPIDLSSFSVVLHNHILYEPCVRQNYCHVMGYKPAEYIHDDFYKVWGFLYGVTIEQKGIDLAI